MKRMLINATQPEELRVAIADGQALTDLDIEVPSREQKKNNVYKGRVTRVEPSLEAAFIDYGAERHGFLSLKEVSREYFSEEGQKASGKVEIRQALKEGQEIVVQVDKEERGNKGAALTTFISLAGRYMVLMPNNPRVGGVSRQIAGEERKEVRQAMDGLDIPDGMGLIVRTAGVGRDTEELQWDLDYLLQVWTAIQGASEQRKAPFLIYQESNLIIRALRDYLRSDVGEILIDRKDLFDDAHLFMERVMPHNLKKLSLYTDDIPLFNRYQIESQIESAFAREVRLPSGGSIVFDPTEALLSIDINSARSTKGADIEETALGTNLEASDEIARQLRLRDLGGLVVIDFIDMGPAKHQRQVEERLREAMKHDRARVQIGRLSRFGLMEMSRQRLRPSLKESSQEVCPRCHGQGTIRGVESLALSILRILEEEAMKDGTGRVLAQVPSEVANFLLNEKRDDLSAIQKRHEVPLVVLAHPSMQTPAFKIDRQREKDLPETDEDASYTMVEPVEELEYRPATATAITAAEKPAVSPLVPATPAPTRQQLGFWASFVVWLQQLFAGNKDSNTSKKQAKGEKDKRSGQKGSNQNRRNDRGNRKQRSDKSGNGKKSGQNADSKGQNKQAGQGKPNKGSNKPKTDNEQNKQQQSSGKKKNNDRGDKARQNRNEDTDTAPATTQDSNEAESKSVNDSNGSDTENNAASSDDKPNNNRSRRGRRGGRRRRGGRNRNNDSSNENNNENNNNDNQDSQEQSTQGEQDTKAANTSGTTKSEGQADKQGNNDAPPSNKGETGEQSRRKQTDSKKPAESNRESEPKHDKRSESETEKPLETQAKAQDKAKTSPAAPNGNAQTAETREPKPATDTSASRAKQETPAKETQPAERKQATTTAALDAPPASRKAASASDAENKQASPAQAEPVKVEAVNQKTEKTEAANPKPVDQKSQHAESSKQDAAEQSPQKSRATEAAKPESSVAEKKTEKVKPADDSDVSSPESKTSDAAERKERSSDG
jgi:ribonuclease E